MHSSRHTPCAVHEKRVMNYILDIHMRMGAKPSPQINGEYIMPIRTEDYRFTRLKLTRPEFNTLVFMGNPPIWEKYANDPSHEFLLNLCFRPLEQVVKEVMKKINGAPIKAVSVFEELQSIQVKNEEKPWFERHLKLCEKFDESLMGPLWIRKD